MSQNSGQQEGEVFITRALLAPNNFTSSLPYHRYPFAICFHLHSNILKKYTQFCLKTTVAQIKTGL